MTTSGPIAVVLAILFAVASAAPYSKYGRSCKDIGCRSDEVCVMAEDPCSLYERDSCGRYPTCQRSKSGGSGESCTTKVCPTGQYCKTENGRPTCVNTTPALTYDSAGVSSVNGQRTPVSSAQPSVPAAEPSDDSRYVHHGSNPYANANAPPSEEVNHHQPGYANNNNNNNNNPLYPPVYPTGINNGYPAYPSHPANGQQGNNNGYPPYPTSNNNNHNNGYPAYPTNNNNNRPGVSVDQYGYPVYPPSRPDNNRHHNTYPQHNLPQHNPGWSNTYHPNSIYRRNGASSVQGVSALLLIGTLVLSSLRFRIASA